MSVLDDKNELKVLMASRKGCFDSDLTECEPPAIWTKKGIILLYNGKNKAGEGDVNYAVNTIKNNNIFPFPEGSLGNF